MNAVHPSELFRFTSKQVREIFKRASSRTVIDGLTIIKAPATLSHGRLLVVTPRRIGNAPKRNRIRRRLKAIYWEQQLFVNPFDVIVIVTKNSVDLPFDRLQTIITKAVAKND